MARAIAVEIVGDASSVERAFGKATVSAKKFDRTLSSSVRGATAGSGVFRSLGRSLAFASGGFLAFAGITSTVRNSIEGAEKLEKAQRGLAVAIQHTGGSLKRLEPQYKAVAEGAAQFGVNQADATTALERATLLTGDAVKAQHAYQEALVISKATGKDFNVVLTATAKGQEGVTTSLQRYGILVKKGTSGQEQFNMVMGRFAGQAKANTSAIDRFNATWQNTEEILGTALLPILNRLLTRFSNWLTKMQKSGELQRDVNRITHETTHIFDTLAGIVHKVDRVTGSFKNTLEILLALKVVGKLARWTRALNVLTGARGAGGLLGAEAGAAGLLTKLRALAGLGVITVEVVLFTHFLQKYGLKNSILAGVDVAQPVGSDVADDQTITVKGKKYPIGSAAAYQALVDAGAKLPPIGKVTAAQEINAARSLGGSSSIPASQVPHRHHHHHHRAASTAAGQTATDATSGPSHHHRASDTTFTLPYRLRLEQAKAEATKTLRDDVRVLQEIRRYILRAIPHLHGEKLIQAYQELAQVNQELADDLSKAAKKGKQAHHAAHTYFRQLNTRQLTAGLGLTPEQRKELRARLSQVGPNGTVPGQGTGAYGYRIDRHGHAEHHHHHIYIDGKPVEQSVTKRQQKRRRRSSSQRRGPHAGD